MKRLLLLALLAGGCGAAPDSGVPDKPDVKPGDNAFAKEVWLAYGNAGFARPTLIYLEGAALDCTSRDGSLRGFTENGECVLGVHDEGTHVSVIAWNNERQARRSIVHEFCHATYGDTGHLSFCRTAADGVIEALRARLAP